MNNELFITHIKIHKLRHLKDIDIPLSKDERVHLILTGKNGSGKTSLLEAIRDLFVKYETQPQISAIKNHKLEVEFNTLNDLTLLQNNQVILSFFAAKRVAYLIHRWVLEKTQMFEPSH